MTRTQPQHGATTRARRADVFDTFPGDLEAPDTERSHFESGIDLAARAGSSAAAGANVLPPSARPLLELDTFLAMRLARLEAQSVSFNDDVLVAVTASLRGWLAAAAIHAARQGLVEPALADTLRGVYAWALGAVQDVIIGEYVRPLPAALLEALDDHVRSTLVTPPATGPSVARPLREIARACDDIVVRGGRPRPA